MVVWFIPLIASGIATAGVMIYDWFNGNRIIEGVQSAIDSIAFSPGMTALDFLSAYWLYLILAVPVLYVGFWIANPKKMASPRKWGMKVRK